MEVFIHEDYVNKRNQVRKEHRRRQQLRTLQVEGNPDGSRLSAAPRESPKAPTQCLTLTGASPSSVRSPTVIASPGTEPAWPPEHRLFDCLKPY